MKKFTLLDWVVISLGAIAMQPIVVILPYVFFWGMTTEDGTFIPPSPAAGVFFLVVLFLLYRVFDVYCIYRKKN